MPPSSNVITTHHRIKAALPIVRLNNGSAATPALTFEDGSGMYADQGNVVITGRLVADGSGLTGIKIPPSINTIQITDSSYTAIDDLALSTTSMGYFVINGNNFEAVGTTVSVGGTAAASVSVVNSTQLRVSVNPKTTGTYDVVVQTGGGSTTKVNGISFDPIPVWTTGTALGNVLYGSPFSITLSATDAATYSNTSALPPSTTLASNGVLQGNIVETTGSTYNFSVEAIDAQLQSALRSFSLVYTSFLASGGTVTTSGNYQLHTFTASGTFTVYGSGDFEFLVIGGGGGGGEAMGGGGGAGQVIVSTTTLNSGSYSVTIGNGGLGGDGGSGSNGQSTTFDTYTAIGGGGGGYNNTSGKVGASGGGGGLGVDSAGGSPSSAQTGYAGGSGGGDTTGGGGGAGGAGATGINGGLGGAGGSAITVWGVSYAGGGGGSGRITGSPGGGGGAGSGGMAHNVDGQDASPNTGSGGGGGGGNNTTDTYGGGRGGSGLVIVRYLS